MIEMSWDFAIDGETGDWVFGPDRDYLTVTGTAILRQNILTRLKIPRGSFIYDDVGSLGSRLYAAMRMTRDDAIAEIPGIVREALAPMSEITVSDVQVLGDVEGTSRLMVRIMYSPRVGQMPEISDVTEETLDLVVNTGA
jgi:hypothetical protein